MARPLALDTNHPLASVFLRNLAWGKHIVKASNHRRKDIINEHLDAARKELGLPSHAQKSGAPHVFIDNLFKAGLLQKSIDGIELVENEKWEKEWRLLHVPSHDSVRRSSFNPIITDDEVGKLSISLRDTSLPHLRIRYGVGLDNLENARGKGVYFLRLQHTLYIGKTDEMETRGRSHIAQKQPAMWVFMSPEIDIADTQRQSLDRHIAYTDGMFSLDALNVTESLLISFWSEVCKLSNSNRGADKQPPFFYLQQGISVVKACSAALMWLTREKWANDAIWNIPFKLVGRDNKWSRQYLGFAPETNSTP